MAEVLVAVTVFWEACGDAAHALPRLVGALVTLDAEFGFVCGRRWAPCASVALVRGGQSMVLHRRSVASAHPRRSSTIPYFGSE